MADERIRRRSDTPARLVVELPVATHRQLKAQAASQGVSIREYVLLLLKKQGIGR